MILRDSLQVEKEKDGEFVLSILKSIDILCCFLDRTPELGVTEISRKVKQSVSTVHRILKTLEAGGFIQQDTNSEKYRLGTKIMLLGAVALDNFELRTAAQPYMRKIANLSGETVNLAILDEGQIVYVDKINSQKAVRTHIKLGQRGFAHSTAIGKMLLSELANDVIIDITNKHGLQRKTPNTITTLEYLLSELAQIRKQKYSLDTEEDEEGAMCIACAIRDKWGKAIAGMSISGPVVRVFEKKTTLIDALKEVTEELSIDVGYLSK